MACQRAALAHAWREEVAPLAHSDASSICPECLYTELTVRLPTNAVLVTDKAILDLEDERTGDTWGVGLEVRVRRLALHRLYSF